MLAAPSGSGGQWAVGPWARRQTAPLTGTKGKRARGEGFTSKVDPAPTKTPVLLAQ